jgi:hypothetical protein
VSVYADITPAALRKAAKYLWNPKTGRPGAVGICEAYAMSGGRGTGIWLVSLMRQCGAMIPGGGYIYFGKEYRERYSEQQEIRFMFLHFMALYLEDEK